MPDSPKKESDHYGVVIQLRRLVVFGLGALAIVIAIAAIGMLVVTRVTGQSSATAAERSLPAAAAPVGKSTEPVTIQSDIYTTLRSQSYGTWSYAVTDNGTGDRHAVINYKHDTIADLKAYAAANKVLLTQVAAFGGQVDIAITFAYPVPVDWFRTWANENALLAHDSQLAAYGPGSSGTTMSIGGKPGDPIPQQNIDNMLGGAFTNSIIGVFGVHGKVDSSRLAKLASEPRVFLLDVTPAWSLHDMAQNSIALEQTPMVDFPYGYMERMGLQNFTDLALPTIPPPLSTVIPTIIPPAP